MRNGLRTVIAMIAAMMFKTAAIIKTAVQFPVADISTFPSGTRSAAVPLAVFGAGIPGMIMQQAATIGVPITFLAFNRRDEEEADFLGLQYLYTAGYDPTAMVSFFEKVRAREAAGAKVSVLFATHPQTEERKKMTQQDIATYLPARAPAAISPTEFQGIKARLKP